MKTYWKLLAAAALVTSIAACSDDHGHAHNADGSHAEEQHEHEGEAHEHDEGTHEHDEQQPETEAYYGEESGDESAAETKAKEDDTHSHGDGEEHSHN